MTTLLTTVGDTDPIRNYRDGAILHICRKYQPEHLIIIHSERTEKHKDKLEKGIFSVYKDQKPTISYQKVISNSIVFRFDLIFLEISSIINDCLINLPKKEDVILNLSSGTPQMKSALFTYFQIRDLPSEDLAIKAVQVASPKDDSNQNVEHQNQEDIDTLIELNEDNGVAYRDRCHEEMGLNFKSSLQKRTIRNLINNYDYVAALQVLKETENIDQKRKLLELLTEVTETFYYQKLPKKLQKLDLSDAAKHALNMFLIIDIQNKRGNIADCLVKLKSLTEHLYCDYIDTHYPNLLENYAIPHKTPSHYFLTIADYEKILRGKQEKEFLSQFEDIRTLNSKRNHYAHKVTELTEVTKGDVNNALKKVKNVLQQLYKIPFQQFVYYDKLNDELISKLEE